MPNENTSVVGFKQRRFESITNLLKYFFSTIVEAIISLFLCTILYETICSFSISQIQIAITLKFVYKHILTFSWIRKIKKKKKLFLPKELQPRSVKYWTTNATRQISVWSKVGQDIWIHNKYKYERDGKQPAVAATARWQVLRDWQAAKSTATVCATANWRFVCCTNPCMCVNANLLKPARPFFTNLSNRRLSITFN